MNKYQEALSEVIRMCAQSDELFPTEEVEALQELVDRATPKKPDVNINNGYCPNCHQAFGLERTKEAMIRPHWFSFCPYCGQLLDWELD